MADFNEHGGWDRIPCWNGDKKVWKAFQRDVEIWIETEKLDVDYSLGARLLRRLSGTAKRFGDNIELSKLRRGEGNETEARTSRNQMTAGIRALMKHLEDSMGLESATRAGEVQDFFYKKLQRRAGQTMSEWVNVYHKAMLDMEEQKCPLAETSKGWHLFEKSALSLERQERLLGLSDGEYDYAKIRRGLVKLFPDHIIAGERRAEPRPFQRTFQSSRGRGFGDKGHGKGKNSVRGDRGRFVAHETNEGYDEENYQDGPEQQFSGAMMEQRTLHTKKAMSMQPLR